MSRSGMIIGAVLLLALLLRLRGLAFGLPALLDPDEPTFVLLGLKLLRDHTLNPGWFGHPGTTTIYALTLINIGVFLTGHLTGRFPDAAAFTHAIYADPSVVFLPDRVFILLCGLACVWLTWRLGRAVFDDRVGLLAAALMAIDPLEIRYSQIIRTDMHMTVFLLLTAWAAVLFVQRGRTRYLVLAGIALGFACATKWPAATALAGLIGGCLLRWRENPFERRQAPQQVALLAISLLVALFVASPYIFLDAGTVLSNIQGEAGVYHLGATGTGPLGNLWWYVSGPMTDAMGAPGLILALAGLVFAARASRTFGYVLLPIAVVLLVLLVFQHLIWERWVVPALPLLAIALAWMFVRVASWLAGRGRWQAWAGTAMLAALVAVPPLVIGNAQAVERATDTRRLATAWLHAHVAPGSRVTIEYMAFDVLPEPWRFYFPAGDRGCIDVREALAGKVQISTVSKLRGARSVVDLSNVAPDKTATCRTDYIVSSNWDRYRAEADRFPDALKTYAAITAGATLVATFPHEAGRVGGYTVRIWKLPHTG